MKTPCVLIDLDTVDRNIERMSQISHANMVALRPHTKTHKIPRLAKKQLSKGAQGITVAKVSEAEIMAKHGLKDIFIAYPVVGEEKIRRVQVLNKKFAITVGVDSIEGAGALARAARRSGELLNVRLEVDTGFKRTGVKYAEALTMGKKISEMEGIELTGIFTFRGLIYQEQIDLDREKAGLEEGRMMVSLADQFRSEGINIVDVSVGSTPTAEYAAKIPGVTEIRPGTYIFYDIMNVKAGSCNLDDCAAKVLVTVVSTPSEEHIVVDGGSKAFATDLPPDVYPFYFNGFGLVEGYEDITLGRLSEEHGIIKINDHRKKFRVGQILKIIPNHICSTINLYNSVYFGNEGEIIEEVIVDGRGMVY